MTDSGDSHLEKELALARRALDSGEPRHAAYHLGNALSLDPAGLEAQELVGRVARAVTDPLALFSTEGSLTTGAAVLRSRFLERLSRFDEAIALLIQAQ